MFIPSNTTFKDLIEYYITDDYIKSFLYKFMEEYDELQKISNDDTIDTLNEEIDYYESLYEDRDSRLDDVSSDLDDLISELYNLSLNDIKKQLTEIKDFINDRYK